MNKKYIPVLAVLLVGASIGLGAIGYKAALNQSKAMKKVSQYDWVMELTSEYRSIESTGMDGNYFSAMVDTEKAFLIDERGKKIDEADYGWIDGRGDAYNFTEDGKMGYKRLSGEVLISPSYECIERFDGGYAESYTGRRNFAIDEKGREVYRTANDEDVSFHQISGRYFGEMYQGKYKVIDVETGKIVKEWDETCCENIWRAMPGLYQGSDSNVRFYLDENFDVTFENSIFQLEGMDRVFSEGLCYVEKITNGSYGNVPDYPEVEAGYIDEKGKMVIKTKGSMYGSDFSEGKAMIYDGEKAWAIDRSGKKLFTIKMKKDLAITDIDGSDGYRLHVSLLNGSIFQNGLVPVYDGVKMGLSDEKGNWVVEPIFDDMDFVGERLLAVEYDGKWGIIRV